MPTLTEHIYVSILDRKIFYEAVRWLISERDVSTIATQTGETSFHLHSLIESLSNLYKCTDYELKTHLIFFLKTNQTATFVIVWDFIAFKLLSDNFTRNSLCVSFHPHWILSSSLTSWPGLSAPRSEELPFLKLWGCGVSPLWSAWRLCLFQKFPDLDKLSDYDLSKGHRSRLSGCFQGVEGWGSLEVWGSKFFSG